MTSKLTERVQRMLDGETKRREIALKWVLEVEEILLPVADHIWGSGDCFGDFPSNTITLTRKDKDGTKKDTVLYYRYLNSNNDSVGFYDGGDTHCNDGGTEVSDLMGKDFWYAIQVIIDWVPQVIEMMDKRETSRDALLKKIVTDGGAK